MNCKLINWIYPHQEHLAKITKFIFCNFVYFIILPRSIF